MHFNKECVTTQLPNEFALHCQYNEGTSHTKGRHRKSTTTTTTGTTTGSLDFVRDNPGEPVPEEIFITHIMIINHPYSASTTT